MILTDLKGLAKTIFSGSGIVFGLLQEADSLVTIQFSFNMMIVQFVDQFKSAVNEGKGLLRLLSVTQPVNLGLEKMTEMPLISGAT